MQSMHRQLGRFMKRSADESQVSVLLKDFDNADKLLAKIIEATKAWRDAWSSLLTYQSRMINEFDALYAPIVGSSDPSAGYQAALTPESTLARTSRLKEEYDELRQELLQELSAVEERMIMPAGQAKEFLAPMKKPIKKREDRKLDYERYQSRVDNYSKKSKRSDRDNAALAKAESDLTKAKEEYNAADNHLRQHLPNLLAATFSLLPHLLAAQIEIQNSMLAHYYTVLHNYSEQEGFPSPPPPMEQVLQHWESSILPAQRELERLDCIAGGKTVRQGAGCDESRNGGLLNGRLPNGINFRRTSSSSHTTTSTTPPARPAASPGGRGLPGPTPVYETKPQVGDHLASPGATLSPASADSYATANGSTPSLSPLAYAPAAPRPDYFTRERQPSFQSTVTSPAYSSNSVKAAAAAKKKPPPPPPPPRSASASNILFVTALYDFDGQGAGDLAFREGDRIRVLKKSDSTDDWWEGELRGVRGSFPANYVK